MRAMPEFKPFTEVRDLADLDEIECQCGYAAGLCNLPEPVEGRASRSFHYGWVDGMLAGGHLEETPPSRVVLHYLFSLGESLLARHNGLFLGYPIQ